MTDYFDKVNKGFKKNEKCGVVYYTVEMFEPYVDYCFCGDIDNGLDFKVIRNATREDMIFGFKSLFKAVNMPFERAVMTDIIHGTNIVKVDENNLGYGISNKVKLPPCDGLVTDKKQIPIATTHADCMPIAFYDKSKNIGCVVHAGWRGVIGGIDKEAIRLMVKEYDSDIRDIIVAIGPTIGGCCFEVDKDLSNRFKKQFGYDDFIEYGEQKDRIDLKSIVLHNLESFSILPENVTVDTRCTCCDKNLHSFRRMKNECGTMVQVMMLR